MYIGYFLSPNQGKTASGRYICHTPNKPKGLTTMNHSFVIFIINVNVVDRLFFVNVV